MLSGGTTIFQGFGEDRTCELLSPRQERHHVGAECFQCAESLCQTSYAIVVLSVGTTVFKFFVSLSARRRNRRRRFIHDEIKVVASIRYGFVVRSVSFQPILTSKERVRCILRQASTVRINSTPHTSLFFSFTARTYNDVSHDFGSSVCASSHPCDMCLSDCLFSLRSSLCSRHCLSLSPTSSS